MVLKTLTTTSLPTASPAKNQSGTSFGIALVIAALTFNLVLAFVNTTVMPISPIYVMGAELLILFATGIMVWNQDDSLYPLAAAMIGWLLFAMTMRNQIDPKIFRDAFIPVLFYFLGRRCGTPEACDRLVKIAIAIVFVDAVIEWAALDSYLRIVNILDYYVAKGSTDTLPPNDGPGLFTSGLRLEGRTLLPFLGEHRVSSVFLEPVSLGNFGAIVFAWLLLRFATFGRQVVIWMALILVILILGDARFGILLCGVVVIAYVVAPVVRPGIVFVAPFILVVFLLVLAGGRTTETVDNSLLGRLLASGQFLVALDGWQALGLRSSDVNFVDSGYATVLTQFGLFGAAGMWAVYVFGSSARTLSTWRFKLFVCLYYILLLAISTSYTTIKTAALLWFLAGGASTWGPRENDGATADLTSRAAIQTN